MEGIPKDLEGFFEGKIDGAKAELYLNNGFNPSFYVVSEGGKITETIVNMDEVGKDEMAEMIKTACSGPGVKAAGLIFDAYSLTTEVENADKIPDSIANETDTIETILAFLYLKDTMFIRSVPYKKLKEKKYWFSDGGWKESPTVGGRFSNPLSS